MSNHNARLPAPLPVAALPAAKSICAAAIATLVAIQFSTAATIAADQDGKSFSAARNLNPRPEGWAEHSSSGPLCGVYAARTALGFLGIDCEASRFISHKYVGSLGGSSADEIGLIVTDAGAHASLLTSLSAIDLRAIECPLIANVRSTASAERFDHWVVAVPSDYGITIYDGARQPYELKTAEFLGLWNGVGVCVTRDGSSPLAAMWRGRIGVLCFMVLFVLLTKVIFDTLLRGRPSGAGVQLTGVAIATIALSIAGNTVFGDLANYQRGVVFATAASNKSTFRIGTLLDATQASQDQSKLLIDARLQEDYRHGSIKGAINVPVTASLWEIDQHLERVPRSTPIVVFCQSAHCRYNELVASQLALLGFRDILVCEKGWAEYVAEKKSAQVNKK